MRCSPMVRSLAAAAAAALLATNAWSYQEVPVPDGGVIRGKVTFRGEVPLRKIIPTKDPEVCGGIRDEPEIVVGPDGAVAEAIVYLKDVTAGKRWDKPKKAAELTNRNCRFEPHVQVMVAGTDLAIVNDDPVLHNTHGFLVKSTVFNVAMPKQGMRVEKPVKKPGILRVECDSHGWMRAWIFAADSPYHAVTGRDGGFAIDGVPPGSYTLVVWQENVGETELTVAVKAKETVSVPVELKQ